jgi:hypothetical protein
MQRFRLVLALLIAAACSEDPLSADEKLVGAYNLVSIDGQPLPYSFVDAGQPVTIVSRQLSFVNCGDTLVLTSSQSLVMNIPSFNSFIQDHQGGLRRLGPFTAELYHR